MQNETVNGHRLHFDPPSVQNETVETVGLHGGGGVQMQNETVNGHRLHLHVAVDFGHRIYLEKIPGLQTSKTYIRPHSVLVVRRAVALKVVGSNPTAPCQNICTALFLSNHKVLSLEREENCLALARGIRF